MSTFVTPLAVARLKSVASAADVPASLS